jgi:hypothetical protein
MGAGLKELSYHYVFLESFLWPAYALVLFYGGCSCVLKHLNTIPDH